MRLLLDTHAFLWFIEDNPNLSPTALALIKDPQNDVLLSIAGLWEIAIKVNIGKLQLSQQFETFIPSQLSLNRINLLSITIKHLNVLASLPLHHRDPFDRLIVAQSIDERMGLISKDVALDIYGIARLW